MGSLSGLISWTQSAIAAPSRTLRTAEARGRMAGRQAGWQAGGLVRNKDIIRVQEETWHLHPSCNFPLRAHGPHDAARAAPWGLGRAQEPLFIFLFFKGFFFFPLPAAPATFAGL